MPHPAKYAVWLWSRWVLVPDGGPNKRTLLNLNTKFKLTNHGMRYSGKPIYVVHYFINPQPELIIQI